VPNYISKKAKLLRIKDEIKLLYIKKQNLNKKLYYFHLQAANIWDSNFQYIEYNINNKFDLQLRKLYTEKLNKPLKTHVKNLKK
jgi:hypothetical protein